VTKPRRGIPFVISAPSGTGKTTVCRALVAQDPGLVLSVSHTTRAPRPGERDGADYHFVDEAEFRRLVARGAFLEHARYSAHCYGTSWEAIEAPLERGVDVLLEIETEGARQVRERRPDACLIFLLPPSLAELERRLRGRGTDGDDEIARRLAVARREFAAAALFDAFALNDDLERTIEVVRRVVNTMRSKGRAAARAVQPLATLREGLDPALVAWLPA
jgi:guanylate kinase